MRLGYVSLSMASFLVGWLGLCSFCRAAPESPPSRVPSYWQMSPILASSVSIWPKGCLARIDAERDYLLAKKEYLEARLLQSAPVIRFIGQRLKNMRLPGWLVWLPLLESSYQSQAVSNAGAAGLWQLMPDTASRFGLSVTAYQDERLMLPQSTTAALTYLQWLSGYFYGDWSLALAAYNAGEQRVRNAQNSISDKEASSSFCYLDLPPETEKYVPRFIALVDVLSHPQKYGIRMPQGLNGASPELIVPSGINQNPVSPLLVMETWQDPFIIHKAAGLDLNRYPADLGKQDGLLRMYVRP